MFRSILQKAYAPDSPERAALQAAIAQMEQELPFEVPIIINGEPVRFGLCNTFTQTDSRSDIERVAIDQDRQAFQAAGSFGSCAAYLRVP